MSRLPRRRLPARLCAAASGVSCLAAQVVVRHTAEVDALLPRRQRNATLLYVVPSKFTLLAFAQRVAAQLDASRPPPSIVLDVEPAPEPLPGQMLVSEALQLFRRGSKAERLPVRVTWR